jgi:CHAT domain-containing protein
VAPSAAIAVALWRKAPRSDPVQLLAFGNPTVAAGAPVANDTVLFRDAGGPLPGAAREARTVAMYAPLAEVRLGSEATASALATMPLSRYRLVHFATHAYVDEASMSRTALALAPSPGDDGFVRAGALAGLRLNADLVVLSACRSGSGVVVRGEGVRGLTAPLLEAGARTVVATMWRIDDRHTVPFIRDFYDRLADGQPVDQALRGAQLAAMARGDPPRDWAAFAAFGDGTTRIPLQHPSLWSRVALAVRSAI